MKYHNTIQSAILDVLNMPTSDPSGVVPFSDIVAAVREEFGDKVSLSEIVRATAVLIDELRVYPTIVEPIPIIRPDQEIPE
ncbi:hypothetical protein [Rhodococcoides fascians]|uniref:hypothetical protein n=1 Tax=Rhodococcoides fascians TaxID=1828 RepID=UPI0005612B6A|nr:hypothetical protein [Rhodococcus fascians]